MDGIIDKDSNPFIKGSWIEQGYTNKEIRHNRGLKNFLRATILSASMALTSIIPSYGQHNVHIKTSSLDHSAQGAPISGTVISKDQGDVVQTTDANGDATLTNVGGTMSIKALHPDYKQFEQTFNITSDTTLYFAMPKTHRVGPWGTDDLNADWWKLIYRTATASHDPTKWDHIIPAYVRIEGASVADSLNIVAAMNTMSNSIGFNLFKIVSPTVTKDTTYTIYMNGGNNFSVIGSNSNWIATSGYSVISDSQLKRITHEIVQSQDGWATALIPVPTNSNPSIQDMPTWQPIDGSYLSLKLQQDFRVAAKKQHLRIGNMQNYVALGNVGNISIVSPANGSTDLDTLLNILGTKDANAMWYDFKITTDATGNNVVLAQNGVDRPRIYADLEPGKTYFVFEKTRNNNSTSSWSSPIQISTKAKSIILPDQALLSSPINGATKVGIPVPYNITAPNATSYRVLAASDLQFLHMLKDTIVTVNNPTIPLPNGTTVFTKVYGINSNGNGLESVVISYTTIKANPTNSGVLTPANNATKVTQPTTFTNIASLNTEQYKWTIKNHISQIIVLDTLLNNASGFQYNKLAPGQTYEVTVQPINSEVNGNISTPSIFTIIKGTPNAIAMTSPANNSTEVIVPTNFTSTSGGPYSDGYKYEIKTLENIAVLDTATASNAFTYPKLPGNKSLKIRGWSFNNEVEGPKSEWVIFTTYNHAPGAWNITEPANNGIISFVDKKAKINGTPSIDIDNDNVIKKYHITGAELDTLIFGANNEPVYIDSARLKPDTQYTISAESIDGSKATPTGIIIFKTPKAITGIDVLILNSEYSIFPNPAINFLYIESSSAAFNKKTAVLCSMNGTIVRSIYLAHENCKIDISFLTPGMYLLIIYSQNQIDKNIFRVIKQ